MKIDGVEYCDCYGQVIFPYDGTTIRVPRKIRPFDFHNRNAEDCLSQEITKLEYRFNDTAQDITF